MHDFFKNIPNIHQYAALAMQENPHKFYYTIKQDVNNLITDLENMVNCYGVSYAKLIDGIDGDLKVVINQRLLILATAFVTYYGTATSPWVDGRNQIAVDKCKELCQLDSIKTLANKLNIPDDIGDATIDARTETDPVKMFLRLFVTTSNERMHRTLMQTATGLFIYVLCKNVPGLEDYLNNTYYEEYWRMPLI